MQKPAESADVEIMDVDQGKYHHFLKISLLSLE